MKNIVLICAVIMLSVNVSAQRVTKVEGTTTTDLVSVLNGSIEAGKTAGWGSRDLDTEDGTVTLWRNIGNVGHQLVVNVSVSKQENGSSVTFVIHHIQGNLDNYRRRLQQIINNLSLPDLKLGEYQTGVF